MGRCSKLDEMNVNAKLYLRVKATQASPTSTKLNIHLSSISAALPSGLRKEDGRQDADQAVGLSLSSRWKQRPAKLVCPYYCGV